MAGEIPKGEMVDTNRQPSMPWASVLTLWSTTINALRQSGTTAARPTVGLWVGRMYFDTTLGYPVWVRSVTPSVWVNGAGAAV